MPPAPGDRVIVFAAGVAEFKSIWAQAAFRFSPESRDFAFVPQCVTPAALPERMRGEALPPQDIRLEHTVAFAHPENAPQEVDEPSGSSEPTSEAKPAAEKE